MRIYRDFTEALSEIKRDLSEMGVRVQTKTMQDKRIEGDHDYDTRELNNYIYTVLDPRTEDLPDATLPWVDEEWKERVMGITGNPVNPGEAYLKRQEVWDEFLHTGKFSYTYSQRFARSNAVKNVIERIRNDRYSRQLFIPVWHHPDGYYLGKQRVPCSLGYLLQFRQGKLNLTYFMRSCDFITHFQNDVYLAATLLFYICGRVNLPPGSFTHYLGSFHIYEKDAKGVF